MGGRCPGLLPNTRFTMPRDYKIGMIVGLILVVGAMIWAATRDGLSMKTRRAQTHQALLQRQTQDRATNTSIAPGTLAHPAQAPEPPQTMPVTKGPASAPADSSPEAVTASATAASRSPAPSTEREAVLPQPERPKIKTTKFHIVRSGETLSGIAEQHYGTVRDMKKILQANRNVLKDPNKIRPGMKLIIPD